MGGLTSGQGSFLLCIWSAVLQISVAASKMQQQDQNTLQK